MYLFILGATSLHRTSVELFFLGQLFLFGLKAPLSDLLSAKDAFSYSFLA